MQMLVQRERSMLVHPIGITAIDHEPNPHHTSEIEETLISAGMPCISRCTCHKKEKQLVKVS